MQLICDHIYHGPRDVPIDGACDEGGSGGVFDQPTAMRVVERVRKLSSAAMLRCVVRRDAIDPGLLRLAQPSRTARHGVVVRGLLNKQVGGGAGISEITVRHTSNVMRKMKADSLPTGEYGCEIAPRIHSGKAHFTNQPPLLMKPRTPSRCSHSNHTPASPRNPDTRQYKTFTEVPGTDPLVMQRSPSGPEGDSTI